MIDAGTMVWLTGPNLGARGRVRIVTNLRAGRPEKASIPGRKKRFISSPNLPDRPPKPPSPIVDGPGGNTVGGVMLM